MILPAVAPKLRAKMYNPIHQPRSWRKKRSELIAEPRPSVMDAAKAQMIRAASRLPKLVAFAHHTIEAKNRVDDTRKAGRFPK